MDDFNSLFEDKYCRRNRYDSKYNTSMSAHNCNNNYGHSYRNCPKSKYDYDSKFGQQRYERDNFHLSHSTLCVPHHVRNPSKSTLCMPSHQRNPSKSTLCSPRHLGDKHLIGKDVSTLPYYIVPVLYVPHKPLYEAKQIIEPHIYKAYHCRSKNQIVKGSGKYDKYPPKLSSSKSLLNLYSKKNQKDYSGSYSNNDRKDDKNNYSFEYYDEYFRKYIEGKRSSSDISFCSGKSFVHLAPTPKRSSKFTEEIFDLGSEKRRSISKDFPELFGLHTTAKITKESLRPKTGDEAPTWDSPRTVDAFIETEIASKSCISAQTSLATLKQEKRDSEKNQETQGTQTLIKDIKRNVLVVPNDKFRRSVKRETALEEVPRNIVDDKSLKAKLSDGQLDRMTRKPFGINRNTPRFAVSRLTKSAVPNSFGPSKRSSKRSMNSDSASLA